MPAKKPDDTSAWKPVDETANTSAWKPVNEPAAPASVPFAVQHPRGVVSSPMFSPGSRAPLTPMANPPEPDLIERGLNAAIGPESFLGSSVLKAGRGLASLAGKNKEPWQSTVADISEGVGGLMLPIAAPEIIAQPVASGIAALAGYGGQKAGEALSGAAGASPENARLIGDVTGAAAGYGGYKGGRKALDMIPSAARAGRNFETVMGKAGNEPIDTTGIRPVVTRAQELGITGSSKPKVINDYIRMTRTPLTPGAEGPTLPLNYKQGRDFASSSGRLSAGEALQTNPPMRAQVTRMNIALNSANEAAADRAGVGDEYRAAMKEYRQAAQLKSGLKTGAKVAVGALGAGTAGYLADRALKR